MKIYYKDITPICKINYQMMRIFQIKDNLARLYTIFPYLKRVQNKIGLILSILVGGNYRLVLKNYPIFFKNHEFSLLLYLLGVISFAGSFQIKSNGVLKIVYDKSEFEFSLRSLTLEDKNLLELIFLATRFGADLVTDDKMKMLRKKSVRISKIEDRMIVETYDGLKFFLDSINPGNTIIETFVNDIHYINSKIDFKDKIVIDVGAECGDTALYFAKKGAIVYAIEPMKATYEAMIRNLELNSELSKRIIPINGAIGKNEVLKFYHDKNNEIGESASFVYNVHKDFIISEVKGRTVDTLLKELNVKNVELLKMDCKGCEFFLTHTDLTKVNIVKIEYNAKAAKQSLDKLLSVLEKSGFIYTLYKHVVSDRISIRKRGTIVGIKKILVEGN